MILGKKQRNKIALIVNSVVIHGAKHIENFHREVNIKLHTLRRIKKYLRTKCWGSVYCFY